MPTTSAATTDPSSQLYDGWVERWVWNNVAGPLLGLLTVLGVLYLGGFKTAELVGLMASPDEVLVSECTRHGGHVKDGGTAAAKCVVTYGNLDYTVPMRTDKGLLRPFAVQRFDPDGARKNRALCRRAAQDPMRDTAEPRPVYHADSGVCSG